MRLSVLPAFVFAFFVGGCVSMFSLQDQERSVLEAVLAADPDRPGHRLLEGRDLATFTDLPFTFTLVVDGSYFHNPGQHSSPASVPTELIASLKSANRLGVSIPSAVRSGAQADHTASAYVSVSRPAFSADRAEALVAVSAHPKIAGCGWGYLVHLRLVAGTWRVVAIGAEYVT